MSQEPLHNDIFVVLSACMDDLSTVAGLVEVLGELPRLPEEMTDTGRFGAYCIANHAKSLLEKTQKVMHAAQLALK